MECILVDDGSTDDTAAIGTRHGVQVLATGGKCGPAEAGSLDVMKARADLLLFIEADV